MSANISVNNTALPSGKKWGNRWLFSCFALGIVRARHVPPAALTMKRPAFLSEKTIVSSGSMSAAQTRRNYPNLADGTFG